MQNPDCLHHVRVVRERLAHAHEDDVGDSRGIRCPFPREEAGLPIDLPTIAIDLATICSTIWSAVRLPFTPLIPLAAEFAADGATNLGTDARGCRSPSGIITVSADAPLAQPGGV